MKNKITIGLAVLGMTFAAAYTTGCSSTPKNVSTLSPSSDASTEVAATRADLEANRKDLGELLSPEKFKSAEKSLQASERSLKDKKSSEVIFKDLAESRAWLEQSRVVTDRSKAALAMPLEARARAVAVADGESKELRSADEDLKDLTKKIEKGDGITDTKAADLTAKYVKVERTRITRTQLDPIEARIEQAKKMNAKRLAPKSYAQAENDFTAAQKTLMIDPIDRSQISERIQTASRSSADLMEIARETAKTPGASTEELVLAARRKDLMNKQQLTAAQQQLNNADARLERAAEGNAKVAAENQNLKATVGDLKDQAQPQVLLQKLRSELPEETADIMMTPAGKIMVRLKHLQFKTNSADLSTEAATTVNTVRAALAEMDPKKLTVEGHTDSTGSAARNKTLSTSRAETVASVLKADKTLGEAQIQAIGYGAEQPIKNNQTKEGRAENRRVEITIDTL